MLLQQRAEQLYEQLDRELLNFTPGSRFYSARQLVLRYGVSSRVVNAALKQLEKRGAIETRAQSGIFVLQSGARRRITLFQPDWPSESQKRIANSLRSELAAFGLCYDFTIVLYDYQQDIPSLLENSTADLNIVHWSGSRLSREELRRVAALDPPTVMLWYDLACASIHSVSAGGEYGGMLAAACLLKKGHRKLAVLPSEPHNQDVRKRVGGFVDTARLFGAEATVIDCDIHPGDFSMTRAHDALAAHLQKSGCDFTALFVVSDESTQGAFAALTEAGLSIPGDVSVIGYGNALNSTYFTPPLTTIDGHNEECARRLVAAIHELLSGTRKDFLIDIRVKPILIERSSVRDLTPDKKKKN